MKDDLLIRFIDGKTTPEETELVLKELSQDGEAAKEWMQMVQGARLAGTKPLQEIDSEDFVAKTLALKTNKAEKSGKVIRLPWILSGITAVAASVAIIAAVVMKPSGPAAQGDIIAETVDSTEALSKEDTVITEKVLNIKDAARESVADVPELSQPDMPQDKLPENNAVDETPAEGKPLELTGRKILQESKASAASSSDAPSFEMVKPAKTPYRVKVKDPSKEFVFEWKMTDAYSVRLSIADKDGNVIIDNQWISESRYAVVASDLADKGELDWTVEVTFNDGSIQRKTGKIELVTVTE